MHLALVLPEPLALPLLAAVLLRGIAMLLMAMLVLMGMALIVTLARRVGRGSDRSSADKQSHGGEQANGQTK
ncbi:hypothetical protein GCM10009083_08510 [Halopseudomonas pertucinogena]|uniref:Uncharacterized protein n=1 Tax=Halopseudomonas pertucinogena TaxID=86175 RepID=A0ABQ2CPX8_9GAMM|nr:hypothetical protein GCM10009083_08510 [Halopseudomonas pertucinogena]